MTTPVVFKVDGVDLSATVTPDWQLIQSADRGTTAASGFNLDDGSSGIAVPALKDVTVEIGAATNPRLLTAYTTDRGVGRNQEAIMGPTATDRRWGVDVTDLNALLSLVILRGNNANRPAESDVDRVNWVLSYLNLSGVFDNGFIDSSSPVPMDATDYRGQFAFDVLTTCAESSGFNFFVDWDPSALQATLNYRLDGSSVSRSSDILISNHPADIDGVNTFAPSMDADLNLDPRNVYSGVLFNFAGGAYAYVTRPATATAFRVRETSVTNDQVGHAATATALANAFLDRGSVELIQITVRIRLKRSDATRVQAGQRIQVKLTEVPGFTSYQWININKLTTSPTDESQEFVWADMVLLNIQPTGFHGPSTPPGTSNPAPGPGTSAGPCGITDTFDRADQVDLGTASSGYLWSTLSGSDMQIVSDQGSSPSGNGVANLAAPLPLPMHGQIDLTGATLISQFGYISASGLAGWHKSGGGTAIASSDGSVATIRDAITNAMVFKASGAVSIAFVITALGGTYTPPDHIVLALGSSTTAVVIAGDSVAGNVTLQISDGSGSPGHSASAVLDASWTHFQGAGLAGTLLITQDVVTGVITASIGSVSVSCLGNGTGGPADSELVINNTNTEGYNFEVSSITFDGSNAITTYGWNWVIGGPTDLVYTDYVTVTLGYAGTDGPLPFGFPLVGTPCIYVMASDGTNSVFASTSVPSDFALDFPFTPVVDLTATDATLFIGGYSVTATFASATPTPLDPIAFIDAGVTHEVQGEGLIASDLTFNDLNITGVNGCTAMAAGIPVTGVPAAGSLVIATSGSSGEWLGLSTRHGTGAPTGAPAPGELPVAVDTTPGTGGVYYWTGTMWIQGASAGAVVVPFSGSASDLETAVADMSIDVIEIAAGVYPYRAANLTTDRTIRPLTIRPAIGATVEFNCAGDGNYGDSPFELNAPAAHITFDGTNGLFYFHHILLAQTGLFTMIGVHHINLVNFKVRNVAGNANAADEESAHCLYTSHGNHDLLFDLWDVDNVQAADESGGIYGLNGLQIYAPSGPAVYNVTASSWAIAHANWATVVRSGSSGLLYIDWAVDHCGNGGVPAAVDFGTDNTGIVQDVVSTNSVGTPHIIGIMTDGGGNSWA